MADLLIERMPPQGYAPALSGILDAETAWRSVLQVTLGIEWARPDIDELLAWTAQPPSMDRWLALPDRARSGIATWLDGATGAAGQLVLGVITAGFGADSLALGLIVDLLLSGDLTNPELSAAAVRLERFTSGRRLDPVGGRRWADAASRIVRKLEPGMA